MRDDVLSHLRCPTCEGELASAGATLRCSTGHSFDLARQGYVNLLAGRAGRHLGDSAAMVAARAEFLATGRYRFIGAALAATAVGLEVPPGLAVEIGAGTGYHLAAVLDELPFAVGLALDASIPATRRAARAHPRAAAVVADAWGRLPLAEDCATLLLNVFAPRNGPEFRRVLRRDGVLLVVTPVDEHLAHLVAALDLLRVDPAKPERLDARLASEFTLAGDRVLRRALRLSRAEVGALVGMGPSAWHSDPATLGARLAALPEPVEVTAAVRVTAYRPR